MEAEESAPSSRTARTEKRENKTVTMKMRAGWEKHPQECNPSTLDETIHEKIGEVNAGNVDGHKDDTEGGKTIHKEDGNQDGMEDGRPIRRATVHIPDDTTGTPRGSRRLCFRSCCGWRTRSVQRGSGDLNPESPPTEAAAIACEVLGVAGLTVGGRHNDIHGAVGLSVRRRKECWRPKKVR